MIPYLKDDSSQEWKLNENEEKESSELEAARKWKPGSPLVAELQGAHGDLELDQQGLPWSWGSGVVGHRAAQVVIVAIGT